MTTKQIAARPAKQTRRWTRAYAGKMKGGVLFPVMQTVVRERERGIVTQSVDFELDPLQGRLLTPVTAGVVSVFVPVPAMDALKYPDQDYPGSSDVVRAKLVSDEVLFDLENENDISKAMGVRPISISGEKKVSEAARLSHNCAVNFLRRRKYVKATQLLANSTAITPAILSQTVLDRLNGVLDPEDRVNGMVKFQTGTITASVDTDVVLKGLIGGPDKTLNSSDLSAFAGINGSSVSNNQHVRPLYTDSSSAPVGEGSGTVDLSSLNVGSVSLSDFYSAESADRLTRTMRQLVDAYPQFGEELALRWAHGLSVDAGDQPFVLYERELTLDKLYRRAMDGANMDESRTEMGYSYEFATPIPETEFGGVIVTFAYIKPDETLASQPDPYMAAPWKAQNFVADEMALDPVPVTVRDIDSDCDSADEGNVVMYIGNNHLKKNYHSYGWNRLIDPSTVESKNSIWQLEVPMSVTPDSVVYPEDLVAYPWVDQTGDICLYRATTRVNLATPTIFGPVPVEELAAIEDADIFGDNE